MPRSNWRAVPFCTKLTLTFTGRSVVVDVDDVGAGAEDIKTHGDSDPTQVLDLSRQAMAYLAGQNLHAITDHNAGVIDIDQIEVVPETTVPGPVAGR